MASLIRRPALIPESATLPTTDWGRLIDSEFETGTVDDIVNADPYELIRGDGNERLVGAISEQLSELAKQLGVESSAITPGLVAKTGWPESPLDIERIINHKLRYRVNFSLPHAHLTYQLGRDEHGNSVYDFTPAALMHEHSLAKGNPARSPEQNFLHGRDLGADLPDCVEAHLLLDLGTSLVRDLRFNRRDFETLTASLHDGLVEVGGLSKAEPVQMVVNATQNFQNAHNLLRSLQSSDAAGIDGSRLAAKKLLMLTIMERSLGEIRLGESMIQRVASYIHPGSLLSVTGIANRMANMGDARLLGFGWKRGGRNQPWNSDQFGPVNIRLDRRQIKGDGGVFTFYHSTRLPKPYSKGNYSNQIPWFVHPTFRMLTGLNSFNRVAGPDSDIYSRGDMHHMAVFGTTQS